MLRIMGKLCRQPETKNGVFADLRERHCRLDLDISTQWQPDSSNRPDQMAVTMSTPSSLKPTSTPQPRGQGHSSKRCKLLSAEFAHSALERFNVVLHHGTIANQVKIRYDEYFKTNYNFDEYLEARFSPPYPEPASNTHNSYNWRHGKEGQSTWVTMASFPERMATFQMGLAALDSSVPAVGSFYDFGQLVSDEPDRIELVDVGGGHGRVLKAILDATPTLDVKKCVLQDQPNVLEGAREKKTAPEGVRMMAIDFHTEQPVKGWFRSVWSS